MRETISFQITHQFVQEPRLKEGVKVPSRKDAKSCQFVFMRKTDLSFSILHIRDRLSKSFYGLVGTGNMKCWRTFKLDEPCLQNITDAV